MTEQSRAARSKAQTVAIDTELILELDEELLAQKRETGRMNLTKRELVAAAIRLYLETMRAERAERTAHSAAQRENVPESRSPGLVGVR